MKLFIITVVALIGFIDCASSSGYASSCTEATFNTRRSGVYSIQNDLYGPKPFKVYCDESNGGGWTVVLRREDGAIDFYRKWADYKRGFGNLEGEFFIGLEKLHAITNGPETYELLFILEDFENVTKSAKYSSFAIGDESEKYNVKSLGKYSGNAGDAFKLHGGYEFETQDTVGSRKCATKYIGAWWYNNYKQCHSSNLCGMYLKGDYGQENFAQGVVWDTFRGDYYSLKYAIMMIRPQRFTN